MPVPSSLALTSIPDGSLAKAADSRNNFSAIQTAVNAVIGFLGGGGSGALLNFNGTDWSPSTKLLLDSGNVKALTTNPVTRVNGGSVIAAGTLGFQIDAYGNILGGPNTLALSAGFEPTQSSHLGQLFDFVYFANTMSVQSRGLALVQIADPADLVIGRAEGAYPYGTPQGILSGTTIGLVHWRGHVSPNATPGATGSSMQADSASIYVKSAEDFITNPGVKVGANMWIATAPIGGSAVERLEIRESGAVALLSASLGIGVASWALRGDFVAGNAMYALGNISAKVTSAGAVQAASTAQIGAVGPSSEAGLLLGGDTNWYRDGSAGFMKTSGAVVIAGSNGLYLLDNAGAAAGGIKFGASQDVELFRSAADRLKTNDLFDATGLALATKVKAGAPVDGDWAVAPPNGTLVVDSTNNKIWARVGGVWKGVVIA